MKLEKVLNFARKRLVTFNYDLLVHLFLFLRNFRRVSSVVFFLQVGTADALAFFLPGVVSQITKVLHASKGMTSGAAGSVEAIDQALRGLAEFLVIVLRDDANMSSLDMSVDVTTVYSSNNNMSTQSFMEELRRLPIKAQGHRQVVAEVSSDQSVKTTMPEMKFNERKINSGKEIGSLHVNRTKDWIEKTSVHVDKLLGATFPHVHFLFHTRSFSLALHGLCNAFFFSNFTVNRFYSTSESFKFFVRFAFILLKRSEKDS